MTRVLHQMIGRRFVTLQYELLTQASAELLVKVRKGPEYGERCLSNGGRSDHLSVSSISLHSVSLTTFGMYLACLCFLKVEALQAFYRDPSTSSYTIKQDTLSRRDVQARFAAFLPLRNHREDIYHVFVSYR